MKASTRILVASEQISELCSEDFAYFQDLIFQLAGISLNDSKADLVKSRLRSHIHAKGLRSFSEYRKYLASLGPEAPDLQMFVNLLTTNKTEFFREPQHFEYLVNSLIPQWRSGGKKEITVWSCASSTGQEPYSLALVLNHHLPKEIGFRILATDIDTEVLSRARNGVYPVSVISAIPSIYQSSHLRLGHGRAKGWFRFEDEIHRKIRFEKHNLIDAIQPSLHPFDLIFCRNVLIYFSRDIVQSLVSKFHRSLQRDGTLIIGHSESAQNTAGLFKTVKPSIFKKIVV